MANNKNGKKDDPTSEPQPQIDEAKPEGQVEAEFIGTVEPKYKQEQDVGVVQELGHGIETGAKDIYKLAARHKAIMAGLAAALVVAVVVAVVLSMNLQATSGKAASLSTSYNSVSQQNTQLSSQLQNLSQYRNNFTNLRNQIVSLQSALSNLNITIQNLHYSIGYLNGKLSNSSNQLNNLNSTIFDLDQQIYNLTRHVNAQYETVLVAKTAYNYQPNTYNPYLASNLQLGSGQSYQVRFATQYSGYLEVNITDPYPYKVEVANSYEGAYFTQSYPGSVNSWDTIIPVYGTPSDEQGYILYVYNEYQYAINGSIGVYLYN